MADFFEIDFLDVEAKKSGDAIALRYTINGALYIHVVDGGYLKTGESLTNHIRTHYGNPTYIDHVVATHPDGDHTAGLRVILESFKVKNLWMNRPWLYVDELLQRFSRYTNRDNLIRDLKKAYPNTAILEDIAKANNIPIHETFQGASVGAFTVMAPTRELYLNKVLESEKTGRVAEVAGASVTLLLSDIIKEAVGKVVSFVQAAWGGEAFSKEMTSAENEMSIVQYAKLCDQKILLTGDTGRDGLQEFVNYAPWVGLTLPGIDRFQVPHHGSRRNISTELLDQILGPRLAERANDGTIRFTAFISSAKEDEDHPRKAVVRAMHHRGGFVVSTEGQAITTQQNAAPREGWSSIPNMPYPEDQED
ncbi:ComEC/Rec2 family competence protein [Rhizobium sp. HT1-10]|uniref:ComEC/Rec2 family competence protein n=1 Tax=Rhizobium sp. HT1-10 TaxID=3111638 RepID=UPI003C24F124